MEDIFCRQNYLCFSHNRILNYISPSLNYLKAYICTKFSKTSMTRTPMSRLPLLFRVPRKFHPIAQEINL